MSGKTKHLPYKDQKLMCGRNLSVNFHWRGRPLGWTSTPRLEMRSPAQIL